MTTLDLPDPATSPTFGQAVPDPAEVPPPAPDLPEVPPEVPDGPDGLPPACPTACRWCGQSTPDGSLTVGGIVRIPEGEEPPSDATSVRRVRVVTPGDIERRAYDLAAGRQPYMAGRVVQEVTLPVWRVCDTCAGLPRDPAPVDLLRAALGGLPLTPTTVYAAEAHPLMPYYRLGRTSPRSRGHREPWQHARAALEAARGLLAELDRAGGVPSPTGAPCAICGRTNSPYGWSDRRWYPGSGVPKVPADGLPLCDGWTVQPGPRRVTRWDTGPARRRVGCRRLVEAPHIAGPLIERVRDEAQRAGAEVPHPHHVRPEDRGRFYAAAHPEYGRLTGPRPPWWHVSAIPTIPAEPDPAELAERLARLEAAVAGR